MPRRAAAFRLLLPLIAAAWISPPVLAEDDAVAKAVRFLSREVPRWPRENGCFSCHHNGDAARALYTAASLGHAGIGDALAETTTWLESPGRWNSGKQRDEFSDPRLAAVQFGFALATATETRLAGGPQALRAAAELVAARQAGNGSWPVGSRGTIGSPATYGPVLATVAARRVLAAADPAAFKQQIELANHWLVQQRPVNVFQASALLLAFQDLDRPSTDPLVTRAWAVIRRGETESGGWGPYVNSPPEPFDTAMVMLAAHAWRQEIDTAEILSRGRRFLLEQQLDSGGWTETTRPANNLSYAQHLSTSGWVTLALLTTSPNE